MPDTGAQHDARFVHCVVNDRPDRARLHNRLLSAPDPKRADNPAGRTRERTGFQEGATMTERVDPQTGPEMPAAAEKALIPCKFCGQDIVANCSMIDATALVASLLSVLQGKP